MADHTILVIRHAEKPEAAGDNGIDATGAEDPESLTPRGWQRAGAWAELFAPSLGQQPALPKPTAIFASAPASHAEIAAAGGGSKSRRPLETITPLAAKLGIRIDLHFAKGAEADLAAAISAIKGVVLVCWQHLPSPTRLVPVLRTFPRIGRAIALILSCSSLGPNMSRSGSFSRLSQSC